MRCRPAIGAMLAAAGLVIGCSSDDITKPGPNTRSQEAAIRQSGTLAPPESATDGFSYSPDAPAGAQVTAEVLVTGDASNLQLTATGLRPDRGYAVHAHTKPCGRTGDDAGPHFQNRIDPAATPDEPSVDPAYANPDNEIWLELRTDHRGSATARTSVPFTLSERAPASLVVHEKPMTATGPGEAGTAGGRLACLTVRLR